MLNRPLPTFNRGLLVAALTTSVLAAPSANAVLLTSTYEAQIEAWLGLGDVTFSSIYNQAGSGLTSSSFHTAVDGQGPTISLISIGPYDTVNNTPNQIIGGYNPQSWDSSIDGYRITPTDAERTAFIFNLTYDIIQRQNLGAGSTGDYQTYNVSPYGPTFGSGFDIQTSLNGVDSIGYALQSTYGDNSGGPITRGATDPISLIDRFRISELEVLTFTRVPNNGGGATVPDSASTVGLFALGLLGLGAMKRRIG